MVVYNGRLYVAPVLVVVVGRVYMYNGVGGGMVWIVGFYNGELYAGAGRGAFGVYRAWFKRRCYELDVGCGCPWRGLFVSRGFLLIGDSLYGRSGMAGGFMPTWMRAVSILQSLGICLRICLRWRASGMVFSGLLLGRGYVVFGGV